VSTDSGSGFDDRAAGRDAGDERLADLADEETRPLSPEDVDDDALEEEWERKQAEERLNDAF
jgi:hypothetical protein